MKVRRTTQTLLVLAMTVGAAFVAPGQAMTQDNLQNPIPENPNGSYAPESYSYAPAGYPRWTIHYGPFWSTPGYSYYRPLQPSDWGCGPYGPRHNLNASQKSPSGMTWW
jgi:hypothetical protein